MNDKNDAKNERFSVDLKNSNNIIFKLQFSIQNSDVQLF